MLQKLINIFIRTSLIYLITFIWVRYFTQSLTLSLLYSALISVCIEVLLQFYYSRKRNKLNLKNSELEEANLIATTFTLNEQKCLDYFFNLAKLKHDAVLQNKFVIINGKEKTILFPKFTVKNLSIQDVAEILKETNKENFNKLIVVCSNYDNEAFAFAKKVTKQEIIFLNIEQAYFSLMKENNFYPTDLIEIKKSPKFKIIEILATIFNKKKSKSYFYTSLILLFSSFIVRYNIYYVIFSSLLLIMALISFLYPNHQKNIKSQILK